MKFLDIELAILWAGIVGFLVTILIRRYFARKYPEKLNHFLENCKKMFLCIAFVGMIGLCCTILMF